MLGLEHEPFCLVKFEFLLLVLIIIEENVIIWPHVHKKQNETQLKMQLSSETSSLTQLESHFESDFVLNWIVSSKFCRGGAGDPGTLDTCTYMQTCRNVHFIHA